MLRVLGNVIWLVLAGLPLALAYLVFGVVACLFVVTIPFGVGSFRLARYALWPFGRVVVERPGAGLASMAVNVVWFVVAGFWLAMGHLLSGLALCLTVIGIPFGVQCFKMAGLALFSLGKEIVRVDEARRPLPQPVAAR